MQLSSIFGMDRHTGKPCTGFDHVRQSINDILTTAVGERVCNRLYGSELPDLIDGPVNEGMVQLLYGATAIAIADWYPAVTLGQIVVQAGDVPASLNIVISGEETDTNGTSRIFELPIPFTLTSPIIDPNFN